MVLHRIWVFSRRKFWKKFNRIRELGLLLDEKLCFNDDTSFIISKSYSILGFIKRIYAKFRDPYTSKRTDYSVFFETGLHRMKSGLRRIESIGFRHLNGLMDTFVLPSHKNVLIFEVECKKKQRYGIFRIWCANGFRRIAKYFWYDWPYFNVSPSNKQNGNVFFLNF